MSIQVKFSGVLLLTVFLSACMSSPSSSWPSKTYYRQKEVMGQTIWYREAGESNKQTIVMLHGYPSSSHTYRELIPLLSGKYHVIAPDHLGSGFSSKPSAEDFEYDFDALAAHVDELLKELDIGEFVLYMQDFGAPVGFRLMRMDPDRVQAVIAQNANAYLEGIPADKQRFFREAQTDTSAGNVEKLYNFTSPDAVKHLQYLRDVKDRPEVMSPDTWTHDGTFLSTEHLRRIQVELFQDYKTNLDRYPEWQAFLREHQFPILIPWGKHDPVFTAEGARAYLKDSPKAELHLLDAGHFAVEEKAVEIAQLITSFLGDSRNPGSIKKQKK